MGVNKYEHHLYILPEDDANRQLANGFLSHVDLNPGRRVQVMPSQRGWGHVLEAFQQDYQNLLLANARCHVLSLLDFDDQFEHRLELVNELRPGELEQRVFVLGVLSEPEHLRSEVSGGDFEAIGEALADDCPPPGGLWDHALLQHNHDEALRLRDSAVGRLIFA